jgi:hypothetical protein
MSLLVANRALFNIVNDTDSFKFTINTTLGIGSSLQLPLPGGQTYNFVVDWGDGNQDTITAYNQAETLHTYASGGIYQVSISGKCGGWRFNNGGDKFKITSVDQWGDVGFDYLANGFFGCSNLTSLPLGSIVGTSSLTSIAQLFQNCTFSSVDNTIFDLLTEVTLANNVFTGCINLTNLPNVSNMTKVTSFAFYARDCGDVTSIPEDYFYSNKLVTNYRETFYKMKNIALPARIFDLSALSIVTSFRSFMYATNTSDSHTGTIQDIWNHSTPTEKQNAFYNQTSITNYVDIPFEWKGMVEVGTLTTDQTTLQQVGINRTYSGIAEINWGDGSFTRCTSGAEALHDYGSTGTYSIKLGAASNSSTTSLIADNNRITGVSGLKTGLLTDLRLYSNLITGNLDLTNAPVSGILSLYSNASLSGVTFASSGNSMLTSTNIRNCNLSTLNLQNVPVSGYFECRSNPLLASITFASSGNGTLTQFRGYSCNFTSLDFTNVPISGLFYAYLNSNLTSITFASSGNGTVSNMLIYSCNLSSLDLSNVPISGTFNINGNTNLSSVTHSSTNGTTTVYYIYNCNLTSLDVSNITISGSFIARDNSSLSSITFNASNGSLGIFDVDRCNLPNIDFSVFSNSDGITIEYQDNSMTSTEVDNQLINLDSTSWINGDIEIDGTNAARTSASDTAYNNLIANGWTITVN